MMAQHKFGSTRISINKQVCVKGTNTLPLIPTNSPSHTLYLINDKGVKTIDFNVTEAQLQKKKNKTKYYVNKYSGNLML